MSRPEKCRCICSLPKTVDFSPSQTESDETVILRLDEYETIRLLDVEKKTQAQCAARMNISRPTVTRIYDAAREKIADALIHGKKLHIGGGDVLICREMRPECAQEKHCCHRIKQEVKR